jgi:hypothetical protein
MYPRRRSHQTGGVRIVVLARAGCGIYGQRPAICRSYACNWLVDGLMPEYWSPLRSKMVLDMSRNKELRFPQLRVHVHPKQPNRWREEPYHSDIRMMARVTEVLMARHPEVGRHDLLR